MDGEKRYFSEFAVASLVMGVLSFLQLANLEKALAAIAFGVLALARIKQNAQVRGKWLAVAGIVLALIAITLIIILLIKFWPQIQQMRQESASK
jgi:hypothetical protein